MKSAKQQQTWRQWLWFVGLWLAGVACVTVVGLLIRWVLHPA